MVSATDGAGQQGRCSQNVIMCAAWEGESRYTTVKYWDESPSATSLQNWMDSNMQLNVFTVEQHAEAFVYHVQGGSLYAAACSDCTVVKVCEYIMCHAKLLHVAAAAPCKNMAAV